MRFCPCHNTIKHERLRSLLPLFAILTLGFLMRLYVCANTSIVNPDGPLYVHQARAIYFHQWNQLTSCNMNYVSPYPFLIAAIYAVFKNWIASARAVSLLFGTIALMPMYLLLRMFFERYISLICLLLLALIPTLVAAGADLIKGPVSWPFLAFGLYFFVKSIDGDNSPLLALSSICFLAGATARIEVILFLVLSFVYLLFGVKKNRIAKIIFFLAPVAAFSLSAALILKGLGSSVVVSLRIEEVLTTLSATITGYKSLRQNLGPLIHQPVMGPLELFLEQARHLVWFIGLGSILSYIVGTFFYPFFFPFILGLPGIVKKARSDSRIGFLVILSLSALILLYFHLLQTWMIANRFFVLFMFPSFICIGYGIEKLLAFFAHRFRLGRRSAIAVVCLAILAFGLPKNLKPRESDKIVFRQIGELIAHREGNAHVIHVASSLHLLRWISFYSNLKYRGAPCPQPYSDFAALVGKNYASFVKNLRAKKFKYFVWEEKEWPKDTFNFEKEVTPDHFKALGSWSHPDSGRIVLYQVS